MNDKYMYSIHREWIQLRPQDDGGSSLVWVVQVWPMANENEAKVYIEKVRKFMQVDFPKPEFRIGESQFDGVTIIGPFENASESGEFVDNLIRFETAGYSERFTVYIGDVVVSRRADYDSAYLIFSNLCYAAKEHHSIRLYDDKELIREN